MPTLDERLRTERSSRNLTQEEIASIIKKSRATYAKHETGDREPD